MELIGKVIKVLPEQTFDGRNGKTFVKNGFVIETQTQYSKKVMFNVFNVEAWGKMGVRVGKLVSVGFDVESREYNGNYYTSCVAWKVSSLDSDSNGNASGERRKERVSEQHAPQPKQEPSQNPEANEEGDDSVPF